MSAFTLPLARRFRDHHGIASSHDLRVLNLSSEQRRSLLQRGVLEEVFEGVYHLASTPLDVEARCAAVCAADVSLVISCCSARALSSLRRCSSRRLHATTDRATKPLGRGVVVHRRSRCPRATSSTVATASASPALRAPSSTRPNMSTVSRSSRSASRFSTWSWRPSGNASRIQRSPPISPAWLANWLACTSSVVTKLALGGLPGARERRSCCGSWASGLEVRRGRVSAEVAPARVRRSRCREQRRRCRRHRGPYRRTPNVGNQAPGPLR